MSKPGRRAGASALSRLFILAIVSGLIAAGIALPVAGIVGAAAKDSAQTFNTLPVPHLGVLPQRSEILDSKGHLIAYYYPNNIDRVPVSFGQISPVMRDAIVAIEDSRFYQHGALDPRGTVRAIVNDLSHHPIQGASTLAQQYVKNALLLTATTQAARIAATADTLSRKIRQLRMAVIVEHQLTKHQLLAAYLNAAYFENEAYGIQVAAERYFSVPAARLNLDQSAMLAGLVQDPAFYDPLTNPKAARARRNVVLARMAQLHYISRARAVAAGSQPLGLRFHYSSLQSGCTARSARDAAFFCDYVFAALRTDPAYRQAEAALGRAGGLKIYTTLGPHDQRVAEQAVNFIVPPGSGTYNPGQNAAAEVLIKPGTGAIRAIAIDRPYGFGAGQSAVDYAANEAYDGGTGVQTGSSSKLFTLLTALKQGVPFGFRQAIVSPSTVGPYYNCRGQYAGVYNVSNAEGAGKGTFTLYNGTTQSINVFFAHLEQKVGLCNVVRTAASLGMTRGDGTSLLRRDHANLPADDLPSFTLGTVPVSPMSMAAAYATVAARGIYCRPVAITRIVSVTGQHFPVESAHCHRAVSAAVADAANYVLQGVISSGTAAGRGIGIPAAGKTGTSDKGYFAAFAGYTPLLAGYASVFNPIDPTGAGAMEGSNACYREVSGSLACPGEMFGDNAPAAVWQDTFLHLGLPAVPFAGVPPGSPFFSEGSGQSAPKPPRPPRPPAPGPPGGPGGGNGHGHGPPGGGHHHG